MSPAKSKLDENRAEAAALECALRILSAANGEVTKDYVAKVKKEVSKKFRLSRIPGDVELLKAYEKEFGRDEKYCVLRDILRLKPVRTISGVAVVSVMTSPAECPHGRCMMCPGGVRFNTPQSYIGFEPAAQRGRQHNYNPYLQVISRVKELEEIGHSVDKVEVIIMGGTFPARSTEYKYYFITNVFKALNDFPNRSSEIEPSAFSDKGQALELLEKEKLRNERARARCVGLTIETRPDYAMEEHIVEMLQFGATKVEIGVQSVYDEVLETIKRGHTVEDVVRATELLKDSGFKVGYHVMPGLPFKTDRNPEKDVEMFRILFEDERFKPDYLKIYPTLVVEGTELYEWYKAGKYRPYSTEEVVEVIAKAKRFLPEYVRVQRVQRDIPVGMAIGLDKGNIRQLVRRRMNELNYSCRCIRCREIGHRLMELEREGRKLNVEEVLKEARLVIRRYRASRGVEYFISYEVESIDALVGFIRLRFPGNPFIECLKDCALVRELHVYGTALPVGYSPGSPGRLEKAVQHRGFGEKLLEQAEEIAKEKYDRIAVISGVGVRPYYRKLGYEKQFEYMVKNLNRI